jgi:hypothetical protein
MSRLKLQGLALLSLALSPVAAAQSYSLVVNGQVAPARAIVVNGQTYVPLSSLKSLGIPSSLKGNTLTLGTGAAPTTAPGGSNQRASLEGCVGDALFNGVWQLTVKKVEPIGPNVGLGPGWGVTVELRNGTKTRVNVHDTGLTSIDLVMPDGNTLTFEEHDAEENLIYKDLVQAGGVTYQLKFHVEDTRTPASALPRPAKLIMQFDPRKMTAGYLRDDGVTYTTPTPSFRVRLDCHK